MRGIRVGDHVRLSPRGAPHEESHAWWWQVVDTGDDSLDAGFEHRGIRHFRHGVGWNRILAHRPAKIAHGEEAAAVP